MGPGEADLWWIGREDRRGETGCLSPDELDRARRLADPAVRADFVRHRAALRTVLAGYLGTGPGQVRFAYGPSGKPRLAGPDGGPAFSLSHAGRWALIAVGGAEPLGVDLESTAQRVDVAGLAGRFLPELDVDAIAPDQRNLAFFTAWTRYEAMLKAAGSGLGKPLPPESRDWAVRPLTAPEGYVATLVTGRPVTALRCRLPARASVRTAE